MKNNHSFARSISLAGLVAGLALSSVAAQASETRRGYIYWPTNLGFTSSAFTVNVYENGPNWTYPLLKSQTFSANNATLTNNGKFYCVPYSITVNSNAALTLQCELNYNDMTIYSNPEGFDSWQTEEDTVTYRLPIYNIWNHHIGGYYNVTDYNFYVYGSVIP